MADEIRIKTKFSLSPPTKSYLHCKIQSVQSKKDKELLFVCNGRRLLYLFDNNRLLNTYLFPCEVTYFMVDGHYIFAITKDGKSWQVPYSRHKVKTSPKPDDKGSNLSSSNNQSIFSDLLANNLEDQPTTPSVHITEVSPTQAIIYEPNIQTILPCAGFIVTTSVSDQEVIISFYESGHKNMQQSLVPLHRIFLDKVLNSSLPHHSQEIKQECSSHVMTEVLKRFPELLICNREGSSSKLANVVQKSMFELLKPSNSDEEFVVLLGSPDGQVWSISTSNLTVANSRLKVDGGICDYPGSESTLGNVTASVVHDENVVSKRDKMSKTKSSANKKQVTGLNNTESNTTNKRGIAGSNNAIDDPVNKGLSNSTDNSSKVVPVTCQSNVHLVWHLEEPVVSIALASLPDNSSNMKTDDKNAVIIIGSRGNCVILYCHYNQCKHSEQNLSAPIICCYVQHNCLVYSNGEEICIAKLTLTSIDGESRVAVSSSYFPIVGMVTMSPLRMSTGINNMAKLAGVTFNGEVIEATFPLNESKIGSLSQQQGQNIKSLLSNLEEVALQTESLEQDLETINKVLQQLNQDATFIIKLTSSSDKSNLIKLTVNPSFCQYSQSYYLVLKIQNLSKTLLNDCWSILVQISGFPIMNVLSSTTAISHSFNLQNLSHGMSSEFSVEIPKDYNLVNCLSIEVFLCYNIKQIVAKLPDKVAKDGCSVVMCLGRTNMDVLHFVALHCNVDGNGFNMEVQPSHFDELKSFCQEINKETSIGAEKTNKEPQTLKIPIAKTIFTCLTKLSQTKSASTILGNTELQTLHFLMGYADGILEIPQEVTKPRNTGNASKMRYLRISLERYARDDDSVCVVLQAPAKVELHALAEAFIHRMRVVVSVLSSSHDITDRELQDTLRTVEELRSEITPYE